MPTLLSRLLSSPAHALPGRARAAWSIARIGLAYLVVALSFAFTAALVLGLLR